MHKKISPFYIVFLVGLLLGTLTSYAMAEEDWVIVQKAVDGDTLRLKDGRSVRLIGIDAPEIDHKSHHHEPMALESWRYLRELSEGKRVRLELDQSPHDSYGRILAYVYDSNGCMLNQQVVANGFAHVLYQPPDIKAYEILLAAQRLALNAHEGKWRTMSWEEGLFIGNPRSKRFHLLQCPSVAKSNPKYLICFQTQRQAFWEGYAPCRQCLSPIKKELKHK
jgi:micrococcal nuclease